MGHSDALESTPYPVDNIMEHVVVFIVTAFHIEEMPCLLHIFSGYGSLICNGASTQDALWKVLEITIGSRVSILW